MAPHRRRPSPHRIQWTFVAVFAVIVLTIFYLLAGLGPRSAGSGGRERITNEATRAFLERSEELEESFDARVLEGIVDEQDMEVLQRAIDLQEEYIAALPARDFSATGRLERLDRKYSEYMGEILSREAEQIEVEAESLLDSDPDAALARYRKALGIREDIRDKHGTSSYNRPALLSRLQRTVHEMDIRPTYNRSVAMEEEAERLKERGELVEAVERFAEAARLQEEINRTYPGLSLAKPLRASRLREEEAAVLSGQLKRQIDGLIRDADDLLYEEKYQDAAGVFARARELQRSLNLEYPRSPYSSKAREDYLRVRQQNAAGYPDYLLLRGMEMRLNEALNAGRFEEASLLIGQLADRIKQFGIRYSQSSLPLERLQERASYLERKSGNLRSITAAVNADLLPMPGVPEALLLATETPQYLYESVMDANPSRNYGSDLPVETVSPGEAGLFLERMGWLLARPVRFPTVEEFRAAAAASLEEKGLEIFSAELAEEKSRSVTSGLAGPRGFHHLLGNVSEMVTDQADGRSVSKIGGNLRMVEEEIRELRPVSLDSGERNRMVGFRFVVEERVLPSLLPEKPDL